VNLEEDLEEDLEKNIEKDLENEREPKRTFEKKESELWIGNQEEKKKIHV